MSRSSALILLGALTMLAPYSGLPIAMRTLLSVVFGAIVLGIGVSMRALAARAAQGAASPAPAPAPEPPVERQVFEPPTHSAQAESEPEPEHAAEPLAF